MTTSDACEVLHTEVSVLRRCFDVVQSDECRKLLEDEYYSRVQQARPEARAQLQSVWEGEESPEESRGVPPWLVEEMEELAGINACEIDWSRPQAQSALAALALFGMREADQTWRQLDKLIEGEDASLATESLAELLGPVLRGERPVADLLDWLNSEMRPVARVLLTSYEPCVMGLVGEEFKRLIPEELEQAARRRPVRRTAALQSCLKLYRVWEQYKEQSREVFEGFSPDHLGETLHDQVRRMLIQEVRRRRSAMREAADGRDGDESRG